MIDHMGDCASLYAIFAVCGIFSAILAVGYWIEKRARKHNTIRKAEFVKFYNREMCKAAHALSNDDLEDQAQNLIKHIDREWKLKRAGGEEDEQGARCW